MIEKPMDVLHQFPVRGTKQQREAFRAAIQSYAEKLGYSVFAEKTGFGGQNIIIGDSKTAKYLVTANQDTSAIVTLLSVAEAMPVIHRDRVCYVLFDSHPLNAMASYCRSHKEETDKQIALNLDCVGNGDHIVFFPTKKLKQDRRKLNPIYTCCGQFGKKFVTIRDKGFADPLSALNKFPYGVTIAAFQKAKKGLRLMPMHTKQDAVLDQTNVNILRAAICTLISCDAMQ